MNFDDVPVFRVLLTLLFMLFPMEVYFLNEMRE